MARYFALNTFSKGNDKVTKETVWGYDHPTKEAAQKAGETGETKYLGVNFTRVLEMGNDWTWTKVANAITTTA